MDASKATRDASTELPPAGLRERKAAATRLALARALDARLTDAGLAEITADQVAADVGVSRVTFFNYFPTKEHALDYLYAVALYEGLVHAAQKGLGGRAAIELLFEEMGRRVQDSPERARRTFAQFASRPPGRPMPALSAADRALISPSLDLDVGSVSLGATLMRLVDEARAAGEIETAGTTYDLAHLLGAVFFATALVGHSTPKQDWRRLYRHHVDRILGPRPERARDVRRKPRKKGER
jgi:AcrR family transcriptional regulator